MAGRIRSFAYTIVVLLLLFMVTFYIRYSYLTYKVPSIEQGNIILLTSVENFFKRGIVSSYFIPLQSWSNTADKSADYYISHPPFTFLLTYSIFKIFHITPSEFSLQILGMLLHLIGAFFVYLIVLEYFDKKGLVLFFPGIISYITYLFIPVMMNMHLFHIFVETFVQPFWIIGIYLALKIFKEQVRKVSGLELFLLGLTIFLMIYTEWLGVFFAFSLCFVCFYYSHKDKKYISVFYTTIVSGVFGLFLIIVQYSQINGFAFLLGTIRSNLILRSSYFGNQLTENGMSLFNPQSYLLLLRQLNDLMGWFGYLFLGMFIVTIFITIYKRRFTFRLSQEVKYMIMLSLVPPALYTLVFFNESVIHYIYIAKFAVPISIFIGILYKKLILSFKQTTTFVIGFAILKVIIVVVSIYLFMIKAPFDTNYTYLADVSEIIQNNATEDEAIFVDIHTKAYNPLVFISYESKRNLTFASDVYQAQKLLSEQHIRKGVFFSFNQKKNIYTINHIDLNSQSNPVKLK